MYLETGHTEASFPQRLRDNFKRDGFIYFPGFLNSEEIKLVKDELTAFMKVHLPTLPNELVYFEDKSNQHSLKQIQRIFDYSPFFRDLIFEGRFERLASILLDNEVIPKNLQYFSKPPQIGKATPPHQDGYYFMLKPNEAVTMWLALDNVDEENGCIRYVKGSHHLGMRNHSASDVLGFSQGIADFGSKNDIANEVFFTAKPGDLLAHHALTIHRADANTSLSRNRQALGFIYYSTEAQEDKEKHDRYAVELRARLSSENKI